jgi:hypothetical protein
VLTSPVILSGLGEEFTTYLVVILIVPTSLLDGVPVCHFRLVTRISVWTANLTFPFLLPPFPSLSLHAQLTKPGVTAAKEVLVLSHW